MRKGEFRADLYYRLSVFPIEVPPLRKRRDDIPSLVTVFVDRYCTSLGKDVLEISLQVMEALQQYPWPGNVRELQNVIERAVIVTPGSTLRLEGGLDGVAPVDQDLGSEALEDVEREHIVRVLTSSGWQIAGSGGAAERLRMNPSTLRSRMSKLGISRSTTEA